MRGVEEKESEGSSGSGG